MTLCLLSCPGAIRPASEGELDKIRREGSPIPQWLGAVPAGLLRGHRRLVGNAEVAASHGEPSVFDQLLRRRLPSRNPPPTPTVMSATTPNAMAKVQSDPPPEPSPEAEPTEAIAVGCVGCVAGVG